MSSKLIIKDLSLRLQGQMVLTKYSNDFTPSLNLIWGENGSGKTTFLKLLSQDSMKPENILLIGIKKISFMPLNTNGLLGSISGGEILELMCELKKASIVDNNVYSSELFQKCLTTKAENFSNGMRQIFKYYLHTFWNPELLLIDEPMSFLDSKNRLIISGDLNDRKCNTIIFITHQSPDLSELNIDTRMELKVHA